MHLDGCNSLPFFRGEAKNSPREGFPYWSDDGDLMALRVRDRKIAFAEQYTQFSLETLVGVWQGQFAKLRGTTAFSPHIRGEDCDASERLATVR